MIGGGYNAYVQLVQTSDYLVMLTEMVHDARIVPIDGRPPLSADLRQWRGDSRGRWEGDTLGFRDMQLPQRNYRTLSLRGLGLSGDENLHLIERFDGSTLTRSCTIHD